MNENQYATYPAETGLSDVATALWRRKWILLLITAAFLVGAFFVTQHMPKLWQAQAQLALIQRPGVGRNSSTDPSYIAPAPQGIETQIGMLQTGEMNDRALSWLKNQEMATGQGVDDDAANAEALGRSLTISSPKESDLINIAVMAPSRDQALLLTNAVAQSFVQWKRELARKDVQLTESTLTARTGKARAAMVNAQQRLLAYQQKNKILNADSQAKVAIEQLSQKQQEIAAIQEDLQFQQAQTNALAGQLKTANHGIQTNHGAFDSGLVAGLTAQLSDLQIKRNDEAQRVTKYYPGDLPQMDAKIKDIQQRLAQMNTAAQTNTVPSLQTQQDLQQRYNQSLVAKDATQARLEQAMKSRDAVQKQLDPLTQTGSKVNQLAGQAETAGLQFNSLQNALNSAILEENKTNGDVQITQAAIADLRPSKPDLKINLLLGGLLGLFFALITVFILEQADRRIRTENQIERLEAGPILGALPRLSRPALAQMKQKMLPAPVAEAYSLMGANLMRVLGPPTSGQGRIVLITSAQAGEGKSLTAVELARCLARTGKRVVLVDADLRQPSLSRLFDNPRAEGLIEVLSGQVSLDDALAATETPNLSVLYSSAAQVNSADVFASSHMANFLQTIRSRADIIILDAPSCSVVDPLLLAPAVDYTVQVINLGRADEDAVHGTVTALSGLAPLGLFINRTGKKSAPAYQVARSFAATVSYPNLTDETDLRAFPTERTLLMQRNAPAHAKNLGDADEEKGTGSHGLAIPIKSREEH